MGLIQTGDLQPTTRLSGHDSHQIYNGLDCCLTFEIWETLHELFEDNPTYRFEVALQAPYLDIMRRGFRVDEIARRQAVEELSRRIEALRQVLDEFAFEIWGKGLNPQSPKQLLEFFYSRMGLPEVWISQKGERKLSTNREALEKLEQYLYARPFIYTIFRLRELKKKLEIFTTDLDIEPDGTKRFRAAYNIAGTETGRPSSSENAFGTGRNAQNIEPSLRYVFEADPGFKLCVIDLEQVEARDVGYFCGCLFDDWTFLDSCESGDLHTNNAKRIWLELDWTGDPKRDRELADQIFYREFSYRDMAKRGSHLSNYMGTAWAAAKHLKVPIQLMEEFQARYCRGGSGIIPAYPCIPRYWRWIAEELQTKQCLVTPFGRQRHFFGRPNDDTTIREGIAFMPQSTTADRMNLGLWRIWKEMPNVQLLAQTFDSVTFQFSEKEDETQIVSRALDLIRVELTSPSGRSYIVPGEAKIGWNWGAAVTPEDLAKDRTQRKKPRRLNPGGLVKWKPGTDKRKRPSGLQRII